MFSPVPFCVRPPFPLSFYNLFNNAVSHFSAEGCDLFCMSAAYELLNEANAAFFRPHPCAPKRMLRCKEYLDENICDTSLRVSALAEMCGISEVYFRRLFSARLGTSPKQYILDIRIQKARQLLSEGGLKISAVAELCGFSGSYHFCRVFRQRMGVTPSDYRSKNQIISL